MTDRNKVEEKIKKLLELANSANEHEANLALQRANELMNAHGVSEGDLIDSPFKGEAGQEYIWQLSREGFNISLMQITARAFGGRIINMLSTAIEEPSWRWHTYGAAKGSLWQLTRHLASEMGQYGITVNMVSPGYTQTERETKHLDSYLQDLLDHTPMGRFAGGDDVADAIVFLSSERAKFITGANIPVCGGKVMF